VVVIDRQAGRDERAATEDSRPPRHRCGRGRACTVIEARTCRDAGRGWAGHEWRARVAQGTALRHSRGTGMYRRSQWGTPQGKGQCFRARPSGCARCPVRRPRYHNSRGRGRAALPRHRFDKTQPNFRPFRLRQAWRSCPMCRVLPCERRYVLGAAQSGTCVRSKIMRWSIARTTPAVKRARTLVCLADGRWMDRSDETARRDRCQRAAGAVECI